MQSNAWFGSSGSVAFDQRGRAVGIVHAITVDLILLPACLFLLKQLLSSTGLLSKQERHIGDLEGCKF